MTRAAEENLYAVLGVASKATQAEIQSAYKKRARELHPDVNKAPDAEENFKRLVAAYEVLKDEGKRARYDAFGVNGSSAGARPKRTRTKGTQRPPPSSQAGGGIPDEDDFLNTFEYLLRRQQKRPRKDREVELTITLEQAFHGTTLSITLEAPGTKETQRFKIRIPQGAKEGDRLKLKDPNLVVVLHIEPHPRYEVNGRDLSTMIDVAPWEAALGSDAEIEAPNGTVKLKIPSGTSSGQKLRLRGQGLPIKPGKEGEPGDLYVKVRIVVPKTMSERERALWRELQEASTFNPRSTS